MLCKTKKLQKFCLAYIQLTFEQVLKSCKVVNLARYLKNCKLRNLLYATYVKKLNNVNIMRDEHHSMIVNYVFVSFVYLLHDMVYHSNRNYESASIVSLCPIRYVK